jgi:hypothetical protein
VFVSVRLVWMYGLQQVQWTRVVSNTCGLAAVRTHVACRDSGPGTAALGLLTSVIQSLLCFLKLQASQLVADPKHSYWCCYEMLMVVGLTLSNED